MRRNLLLTAMLAVFAVAAASAQRQVNEADGYRPPSSAPVYTERRTAQTPSDGLS